MLTLKTSDFRPAYQDQVNYDHPHNNQINVVPTLRSSQFVPPTQNQAYFHVHKNK